MPSWPSLVACESAPSRCASSAVPKPWLQLLPRIPLRETSEVSQVQVYRCSNGVDPLWSLGKHVLCMIALVRVPSSLSHIQRVQ